jgi:thiamine-monophosphate kinase
LTGKAHAEHKPIKINIQKGKILFGRDSSRAVFSGVCKPSDGPLPYLQKVMRPQKPAKPAPSMWKSGGELALIDRIRVRAGRVAGAGVRLGIGDDCALLGVGTGEELAVTTDLSIAGRHFRLDWHPPEAVGHRTLARGLSDLAAMGARPVAAFLSLGLPPELVHDGKARNASWISRFYDGLLALAEAYKTPLAGGDLAESPVAVADIVLVGAVKRGHALLRSGARAGDLLYVTGKLGGAAAGLVRLGRLAQSEQGSSGAKAQRGFAASSARLKPRPATEHLVTQSSSPPFRIPRNLEAALKPHLYPQPRVAQGLWLARRGLATAGLDLSDGLSTDLHRLCAESGVAAEVEVSALPVYPGATLEQALNGGEDYELLFSTAPGARIPRAIAGVVITRIGRVMRKRAGRPTVVLLTAHGAQPMEPSGWEHFS